MKVAVNGKRRQELGLVVWGSSLFIKITLFRGKGGEGGWGGRGAFHGKGNLFEWGVTF